MAGEDGSEGGASANERLLSAAKTDNEGLLNEVLANRHGLDLNHQDGLGMTALHYATQYCSFTCLELLLEEEVDVDLKNRLQGDAPLHLACRVQDSHERLGAVRYLIEAGADPRTKNKHGDRPQDLLRPIEENKEILMMLRKAEAGLAMGLSQLDNTVEEDNDSGSQSE